MKADTDTQWYIFYCTSRAEKKVTETLRNNGYDVFLPLMGSFRQWSDRKKWVEQPLIPGYVFVQVSVAAISDVIRIPGIVAPLRLAGHYGYLRPEELESVRRMTESGYTVELVQQTILPGETVLVEDGPLRGLRGTCIGEAGQKYLYVKIEALDYTMRARIPAAALRIL